MTTDTRAPHFLALSLWLALAGAACTPSAPAPDPGAAGRGGSGGSGSAGNAGSQAGSSGSSAGGAGGSQGGAAGSGAGGGTAGVNGTSTDAKNTPQADARRDAPSSTEAGPPAAGVTIGGDPKPCTFALCESFEDGAEGAAPTPGLWFLRGTPSISTKYAARGTKSLHIPPITSGTQFIRETRTFPALGKALYTRVFVYVERQPTETPERLYHWTLFEASDQPGGDARVLRLGGHIERDRTNWLRFNYETHQATPGETGLSDQMAVLQPRTWYCLEAYFDTVAQEARFWLDGMERPRLHWQNNDARFPFPPDMRSLSFGWAEYQVTQTPYEVYLDEIVVDSKPIGCDR